MNPFCLHPNFLPIEKNDAFSAENFAIFFACFFSAMKVQCLQPNFDIFFANSENPTKSKFRQEKLNILSALKFAGSH